MNTITLALLYMKNVSCKNNYSFITLAPVTEGFVLLSTLVRKLSYWRDNALYRDPEGRPLCVWGNLGVHSEFQARKLLKHNIHSWPPK